jgi:4-hydroxythreonine-4-phosphate dehydrogenase
MGEPGGVAPEITTAAWRALKESGPAFFVIADPDAARASGGPVQIIADPAETNDVFKKAVAVLPLDNAVRAEAGVARPENANAVIESIERAVALTVEDLASAVVTNPIQKSSLIAAGFPFPGHTEFLESLTDTAPMPTGRTQKTP